MARPKVQKSINVPNVVLVPQRKAPKVNFDELKPAIVDGKLMAEVGAEVYLRRDHVGDKKVYVCQVTSIDPLGNVTLLNETSGQSVVFNLTNPMSVRLPKDAK